MNESNRCAIYARYSSEKQNPLSIDQQIRKCREYANCHGLTILDEHIYSDLAVSGATDDRSGLKNLLNAAQSSRKPFDVLLVDDTSRLSRKLADSLRIHEHLQFARVRVVFIAQGIDTSSEQSELLVATHGIVDSLYIKDLAKRTFRGVEQRALQGLHTGGRVFGYRGVQIVSHAECDAHGRPVVLGVKLEVDSGEAETIRRIFERYASGHSLKRVAIDLNDEGIESPQPQKGRIARSWCPSSVRHILHNERYRGIVLWGKTRKIRSPKTGKRIYERRPENEWRRTELPDQRIVSDELWNGVRARMRAIENLHGVEGMARIRRGRALSSPYLFTGLLECGQCGGSVTVVSGQWKNRGDSRYGCSMHAYRGPSVCANVLLIGRRDLEGQLLAGLQERVLHPDVVTYTLRQFEKELLQISKASKPAEEALRRQEAELSRQLTHQVRALADGYSPAISAEIRRLERLIDEMQRKIRGAGVAAVEVQIRETRHFVGSRISDLRNLLSSEPSIARIEVSKHVRKITLTPEGKVLVASGTWDLLGSGCYDGAGGPSWTERLPVHFEWLAAA